ncbi:zinc-binding CMP/dCMP deaminase [Spiribacter salinus M19-40]|uniref:tRNA-specific adenosine deaminase n=2 Tax=Spiribacter salinus TaxID=1335746 RepID=R4VL22_9GAMM|nr:zinc-binding CMP/dCMP deaminase [Spiribacter salinus M19-40]
MARALELAHEAAVAGEVPVGAVVVAGDRIVGEGWNQPIATRDPSAHAEILALRAAGQTLEAYRLPGTRLYVTLEPCPMCLGAMIHARVDEVIYGASDPKTGACGGALSLHEAPAHNHQLTVRGGVEADASAELLKGFFRARRGAAREPS